MFDVGWSEILVIAIVAIVVIGPKDLPKTLRAFGKATARMRSMAGEFRQQFDEALKDAELDEVRKTISDAQKLNPNRTLRDVMSPLLKAGEDLKSDLGRTESDIRASLETPGAKAASNVLSAGVPKPAVAEPDAAAEAEPKPVPEWLSRLDEKKDPAPDLAATPTPALEADKPVKVPGRTRSVSKDAGNGAAKTKAAKAAAGGSRAAKTASAEKPAARTRAKASKQDVAEATASAAQPARKAQKRPGARPAKPAETTATADADLKPAKPSAGKGVAGAGLNGRAPGRDADTGNGKA